MIELKFGDKDCRFIIDRLTEYRDFLDDELSDPELTSDRAGYLDSEKGFTLYLIHIFSYKLKESQNDNK